MCSPNRYQFPGRYVCSPNRYHFSRSYMFMCSPKDTDFSRALILATAPNRCKFSRRNFFWLPNKIQIFQEHLFFWIHQRTDIDFPGAPLYSYRTDNDFPESLFPISTNIGNFQEGTPLRTYLRNVSMWLFSINTFPHASIFIDKFEIILRISYSFNIYFTSSRQHNNTRGQNIA